MHGENLYFKDDDKWGDDIHWKHPDVLRIASHNVRGFPPFVSGIKNKQITENISEKYIDILLIQETNLHWK